MLHRLSSNHSVEEHVDYRLCMGKVIIPNSTSCKSESPVLDDMCSSEEMATLHHIIIRITNTIHATYTSHFDWDSLLCTYIVMYCFVSHFLYVYSLQIVEIGKMKCTIYIMGM